MSRGAGVTKAVRDAAWARTGGCCWYCGGLADAIDHQKPQTKGGDGSFANCVAVCRSCNSRKHRRELEPFRFYLMLRYGRPPVPFFGEPAKPKRDWLIVCNGEIDRRVREHIDDKIGVYLSAASIPA